MHAPEVRCPAHPRRELLELLLRWCADLPQLPLGAPVPLLHRGLQREVVGVGIRIGSVDFHSDSDHGGDQVGTLGCSQQADGAADGEAGDERGTSEPLTKVLKQPEGVRYQQA